MVGTSNQSVPEMAIDRGYHLYYQIIEVHYDLANDPKWSTMFKSGSRAAGTIVLVFL